MRKAAKQTKTETTSKQATAALPWWLVSRPEGFYYTVRVAGEAMQEIGPFKTKAKATDEHTLAMNIYGRVTVNLMNGDGKVTWEWFRNPVAVINKMLTAKGVSPFPNPFGA